MHIPDLDFVPSMCCDSSEIIYIGTESGSVSVISVAERNLKKFAAIDWKSIFPHAQKLPANPVMAIQVNRKKPHRILLAFKFTGAVIWNIKV